MTSPGRDRPFAIRRLAAGDQDGHASMLDLFAAAFDDPAHYASARPDAAYVDTLLSDACFVALLALADGEPVGALAAYELRKFEQARSEFYIYDLAVAERFRRRGVARALIGWIRDHARQRGGWTIFVQADRDDGPAISLYSSLGTREDVIHFDIPPADRPA